MSYFLRSTIVAGCVAAGAIYIATSEAKKRKSKTSTTSMGNSIKDIAMDLTKKDIRSYETYINNFKGKTIEKSDEYDIKFLVCIGFLCNDQFNGFVNEKDYNKQVDFFDYVNNKKSLFWLEEVFHHDVPKIYAENEKLSQTGKSKFIFRSNLVNFAIMLNCYHRKGFDKFFSEHKQIKLKSDEILNVHNEFERNKDEFVKLLIDAYSDFEYNKIRNLYVFYLKFYDKAIGRKIYPTYNFIDYDEAFPIILDVISSNAKFVYLSFNLQDGYKMAPFEFTNIVISHIGFRPAHEYILNPIMIIEHDLTIHKQHMRIQNNNKYQEFILMLYNNFYNCKCINLNMVQEKYLTMITNRDSKDIDTLSVEERQNLCKNIYLTSMDIIYYISNETNPHAQPFNYEKMKRFIEHIFIEFEDVFSRKNKNEHGKSLFIRNMTTGFYDNNINKDKNIKYFAAFIRLMVDFESEQNNSDLDKLFDNVMNFADAMNSMYQ